VSSKGKAGSGQKVGEKSKAPWSQSRGLWQREAVPAAILPACWFEPRILTFRNKLPVTEAERERNFPAFKVSRRVPCVFLLTVVSIEPKARR
jgi:hypothetical protein